MTEYTAKRDPKRPPMLWQRVPPAIGKHVLLLLVDNKAPLQAREVLDLDTGERQWVPIVRRMIELEQHGADARTELLAALSNPSPLMRAFAIDQLTTRVCAADFACKRDILVKMYSRASDRSLASGERLTATETIGLRIYDGSSATSEINQLVLADLFELAADENEDVRAEAIQILAGYLAGSGSVKPTLPSLAASVRQKVLSSLQTEANRNGPVSSQAGALIKILSQR